MGKRLPLEKVEVEIVLLYKRIGIIYITYSARIAFYLLKYMFANKLILIHGINGENHKLVSNK